MDELAEELVLAQFAETDDRPLVATSGLHPIGGSGLLSEDGDIIVKLGKKWYFGDPKQADTYLQPYKPG